MSDRLQPSDNTEIDVSTKRKESGDNESKSSQSFWKTIKILVVACIIGMVICCAVFIYSSVTFSNETTQTLKAIAAQTTQTPQTPSATQAPATQSQAITQIPQATEADKDETEILIKHMENMIAVQKSGMTNDLLSFVYGILSTILVGLCASFVVKSRENAEKTRETADKAQESANKAKSYVEKAEKKVAAAKQSAKDAEDHASNATQIAKETQDAIDRAKAAAEKAETHASNVAKEAEETKNAIGQAKNAAATAELHAENAAKKAEQTKNAIEQAQKAAAKAEEVQYQLRLVIIDNRIQNASLALEKSDQVLANKEISQISKEVDLLFSDEAFIMCKSVFGKAETQQVYDDLNKLVDRIENYKNECNESPTEKCSSMMQSANNYEKWVNAAIEVIIKAMQRARDRRI